MNYYLSAFICFDTETFEGYWRPRLDKAFPDQARAAIDTLVLPPMVAMRDAFRLLKTRTDAEFFAHAMDTPVAFRGNTSTPKAPASARGPDDCEPASSIHGFEWPLRRVCRELKPKRVLEWGPGRSTEIIHEECPAAEITSIEHDHGFYKKAVAKYVRFARIEYLPFPSVGPTLYDWWPLKVGEKSFDLIFVDGRRRTSCLLTARKCLTPGGLILLHDAERPHYRHVLDLFDVVGEERRTLILRPKP
jgi:hypothetical protein